ncbi:hypothetical protein BpHYR1_033639 [Brachionus plicatilis]|uniref:Uncharacterized protein n=1 Tax=Brachionus plicatilis TaxID=10195 RepID=A0A3M7Q3R3_BRAPC|nr:hypothetical protein BpHYR1_033639 [Brachionus plicatilis]
MPRESYNMLIKKQVLDEVDKGTSNEIIMSMFGFKHHTNIINIKNNRAKILASFNSNESPLRKTLKKAMYPEIDKVVSIQFYEKSCVPLTCHKIEGVLNGQLFISTVLLFFSPNFDIILILLKYYLNAYLYTRINDKHYHFPLHVFTDFTEHCNELNDSPLTISLKCRINPQLVIPVTIPPVFRLLKFNALGHF